MTKKTTTSRQKFKEAWRLLEGWFERKTRRFYFTTELQQRRGYAMMLKLAEAGRADAQLKIGQCLIGGIGVEKDGKAGASWLERAAEQGLAEAQYQMAEYYLGLYSDWEDRRVENLDLAYMWMKRAADQKYFWALLNNRLEDCTLECQDALEKEFRETREAAEAGDILAERKLWILYLGGCGVKRDEKEAERWKKKSEAHKKRIMPELKRRADAGDDKAREKLEALDWDSALPPFQPGGDTGKRLRFITVPRKPKKKPLRSKPSGRGSAKKPGAPKAV